LTDLLAVLVIYLFSWLVSQVIKDPFLTYCKILSNAKLPPSTEQQYNSNKELETVWMEAHTICLRH